MKKLETLEEASFDEKAEVEAESPKTEKKPKSADSKQAPLKEEKVISDAILPSGQLLVEKGRNFIQTLSEQELVSIALPASADEGDGTKSFNIQGVNVKVPTGRIVKVPLSIASLINDIF